MDPKRNSMNPQRKWADKFADAVRGLASGVSGQRGFAVPGVIAARFILADCRLTRRMHEG